MTSPLTDDEAARMLAEPVAWRTSSDGKSHSYTELEHVADDWRFDQRRVEPLVPQSLAQHFAQRLEQERAENERMTTRLAELEAFASKVYAVFRVGRRMGWT